MPSVNHMYQSGCDPAEICAALYGPRFQIGLIWKTPPMIAMTPAVTAKKPPPLAAKTGRIRTPTTFLSVRPGPGNWVCFWYHTSPTCTAISASRMPGMSRTWSDVEPRDDLGARELAAEQRPVRPRADHRARRA